MATASPDFLYPFLHGESQDAARLEEGLLESVRQKALHSVDVKSAFFAANAEKVVEVARAIAMAYESGGKLLAMGNGGSSCDAAHITVEFEHPVTAGRPALTAINLVADMAMITAVGNDVGFANVFTRQIIAHGKKGDALVGISTSGNSENLLNAFATAKKQGILTIGLAGGDGGEMRSSASVDQCLVVESDSIHRVQETHVAIYHVVWDLVHTLLADTRGRIPQGANE